MSVVSCPICRAKYKSSKSADYFSHLEREHPAELAGKSPAQWAFDRRYGGQARCIVCRQPAKWNEASGRYERVCTRPGSSCREQYRQMFLERMRRVHGKDHLLDDPDQQRKMLASRSISGKHRWRDGKTETVYTGAYERDFIEFLDGFMEWSPTDIESPAPQNVPYEWPDGSKHVYIPDFWIPSMDLVVEIKASSGNDPSRAHAGSNRHAWRGRELEIEKLKDAAAAAAKIKMVKIVDKDYGPFLTEVVRSRETVVAPDDGREE